MSSGDDPQMELCDRLKGHWLDVCLDQHGQWYCMWDIKVIVKGFATRDEAKTALLKHITSLGLDIPDDLMVDESPAKTIRITTPCLE